MHFWRYVDFRGRSGAREEGGDGFAIWVLDLT